VLGIAGVEYVQKGGNCSYCAPKNCKILGIFVAIKSTQVYALLLIVSWLVKCTMNVFSKPFFM